MQIAQLQVAFDPRADRLMLRIASQAQEEFRIALTRRMVKALWPHLQRMLEGHLAAATPAESPAASNEAAAPAIESGETPSQGEASDADAGTYDEPFDDRNLTHPLGTEPVLAMESRLQPRKGAICRVVLGELRARQVTFDCDRELMQALCAMIRATVEKAEWNLDLDALAKPAETDSTKVRNISSTLH